MNLGGKLWNLNKAEVREPFDLVGRGKMENVQAVHAHDGKRKSWKPDAGHLKLQRTGAREERRDKA